MELCGINTFLFFQLKLWFNIAVRYDLCLLKELSRETVCVYQFKQGLIACRLLLSYRTV